LIKSRRKVLRVVPPRVLVLRMLLVVEVEGGDDLLGRDELLIEKL